MGVVDGSSERFDGSVDHAGAHDSQHDRPGSLGIRGGEAKGAAQDQSRRSVRMSLASILAMLVIWKRIAACTTAAALLILLLAHEAQATLPAGIALVPSH